MPCGWLTSAWVCPAAWCYLCSFYREQENCCAVRITMDQDKGQIRWDYKPGARPDLRSQSIFDKLGLRLLSEESLRITTFRITGIIYAPNKKSWPPAIVCDKLLLNCGLSLLSLMKTTFKLQFIGKCKKISLVSFLFIYLFIHVCSLSCILACAGWEVVPYTKMYNHKKKTLMNVLPSKYNVEM